MKISIAMATFNGAKYLQQQLDSFLVQTRLPDEMVVCDDGSDDETVAILHTFKDTAPFQVEISENPERLGCTKNFEKAVSLCTGDLIFFSDQDDVWFANKIQVMTEFMTGNPKIMVAVNDAEIVDEKLDSSGLKQLEQIKAIGLPPDSLKLGCCTVFRKEMTSLLIPIPDDCVAHDTWLSRLAVALGVRALVEVPLQYYRRHTQNTSDWLGSSTTQKRPVDMLNAKKSADVRYWCARRIKAVTALIKRLENSHSSLLKAQKARNRVEEVCATYEQELYAAQARLKLLEKPRWRRLKAALDLLFSGTYKRHFSGWQSFLKDLIRK